MFKKILSYIFILFGLAELVASTSRIAMGYIAEKRDNDKWWGVEQLRHGDLASISGLAFLNKFNSDTRNNLKRVSYDGPKNTTLFIHGDSYLWKIQNGDSLFAGVSSLQYIGWNSHYHYHFDSPGKNILIIEVSERLVRDFYGTTEIIDELTDTILSQGRNSAIISSLQPDLVYNSFCFQFNRGDLFNKYINQNLQCNLFNYNFMTPMFGCKAASNYYLFNRASGDVVISADKQYLFFKQTLSLSDKGSSYSFIPDSEITLLINNFNTICEYYKKTGFKEVYLSIIPNTVTVVQPEGYNNLIPRVQKDPRLKMKIIDAYSMLKESKEDVFLHGDTHWNSTGKQKWIDMVNKVLVSM